MKTALNKNVEELLPMKKPSSFEQLRSELEIEINLLENKTTDLYSILYKLGKPELESVTDSADLEGTSIPGDNSILNELKFLLDKIRIINENQRILIRELNSLV